MITHPFITDGDYHQQDAMAAERSGTAVRTSPWCQCKKNWGGIVTCRRCNRLRLVDDNPLSISGTGLEKKSENT